MRDDSTIMFWAPEPGETLLWRTEIDYATGAAVAVKGSRWFRNPDRADIQQELVGWPAGPEYTLHSAGEQNTRRAGRFLGAAVPALLNAAVGLLGGGGSPFGDPKILGPAKEPENEIHDFPVMWAAPGTIARTLPWQLDPARRTEGCSTHAVITDRRLVLLQLGPHEDSRPEELMSIPRDLISSVEPMEFSRDWPDIRIRFSDESWVRVSMKEGETPRILRHLDSQPMVLLEDQLNPAQRAGLAAYLDRWPPCDEPPLLTRRPSGNVLIELRVPGKADSYKYYTQCHAINDEGVSDPKPGDF